MHFVGNLVPLSSRIAEELWLADDETTEHFVSLLVGGPQEKMPIFQIAPGPILSSPIHSNSSQYDPCKVWLKKNDHFLTCGATKVHIFACTSDWASDWPDSIRDWPCTGTSKAVDHLWLILTSILDIYKEFYHLSMRYIAIWGHPYTVTLLKLGQILANLGDCRVDMMPWCHGWRCIPPSRFSHIQIGYVWSVLAPFKEVCRHISAPLHC